MRKLLWDSMLDADMSVRYWDEMIRRHVKHEQRLRIVLALLSSGTAASLIFSIGADWVWKVLSACSAALSIYLSVVGSSKPVERMSTLKHSWAECLVEYEHLWTKLEAGTPDAEILSAFEDVRKRQTEGVQEESHFSRDDSLLQMCQTAVRRSRGI